jgi:hypothetical protein
MIEERDMTTPPSAMLALVGYSRALRFLVLSLTALAVFGGIAAAGVVESQAERPATCGLGITVQDPDLRASFIRFDRQQSAAARKICAI